MLIRLRFQREGAERGQILTLEQLYKNHSKVHCP